MRRLGYRHQRTLAREAEVRGVGFITGAAVRARFRPAPPDTGVAFVRTDLGAEPEIPARVEQVTGVQRRTTLGTPPGQVTLAEHALAALAGLRIDNCYVEIDGPEPPGLDGSARGFVEALVRAGFVLQPARRARWTVTEPVVVGQGGATLALHPHPGNELRISYLLNYGPDAPIARQSHTEAITPENFRNELAGCRTFVLESEAADLLRQGIGKHLTPAELLVFGPKGPIDNALRFADEPARHKILDLVGDLSLCGFDLAGHLVAYRSGHPLNVELARELTRRARCAGAPPCRRAA